MTHLTQCAGRTARLSAADGVLPTYIHNLPAARSVKHGLEISTGDVV